jgi:hypothetical protein
MQEQAPAWLPLLIIVAFPIFFVGVWSAVCVLLAFVSGYRSLLPRFADAEAGLAQALPSGYFVQVGLVSYRGGLLSFDATPRGLGLQVSRFFPFHPPVRVTWDRIALEEQGSFGTLSRFVGRTLVLDGRVRMRIPEETAAAIEAYRARLR